MTSASSSPGALPLILLVCTGNICRSPAAERLLRARLEGVAVRVESAGTSALVGQPIAEPMSNLLRSHGVSPGGFAARRLTEPLVTGAALVLGMTREHRASVVQLAPQVVRRSFTLLEFARLTGLVDLALLRDIPWPDRLAAVVTLAAAERRAVAGDPAIDDVADPFRRSQQVYDTSFVRLQRAVTGVAGVLNGCSAATR